EITAAKPRISKSRLHLRVAWSALPTSETNGGKTMFALALLLFAAAQPTLSTQPQQPAANAQAAGAPPAQQTPAQAVGLFVYPQKQQDASLQAKDEGECYASAKQQSGIDPANLAASAPQTQAKTPSGGGAKGAAGGAAAG